MADIQDFIQMAVSGAGIDEGVAKKATGGLLGALKDKMDDGAFGQLTSQLPGASDLLKAAGGSSGGGGGLMGAVGKLAGGLGGGGGLGGLIGALTSSGLEAGKADDFLGLFANFAKKNLSGDLLSKIFDNIPDLKKLIG